MYLKAIKYLCFLSAMVLFSCNNEVEEPLVLPEEPRNLLIFDYGNEGNTEDVLLNLTFSQLLEAEMEVRLFISKEENAFSFSKEEALNLPEHYYAIIDLQQTNFVGMVEQDFPDRDGDALIPGNYYMAYILVIDKSNSERSRLSFPSNSIRFTDEELKSLYVASSQSGNISVYNPYTMQQESLLAENIGQINYITYSRNLNKILCLYDGNAWGAVNMVTGELEVVDPDRALNNPQFMGIGDGGDVFFVEANQIVRYDNSGNFKGVFVDQVAASSFAWDNDNNFYMAERNQEGRVLKYDNKGAFLEVLIDEAPSTLLTYMEYDKVNNDLMVVQLDAFNSSLTRILNYDLTGDYIDYEVPYQEPIITSALVVHGELSQFVMMKNTPRSGAPEWKLTNFDMFTGIELIVSNRILGDDLINTMVLGPK